MSLLSKKMICYFKDHKTTNVENKKAMCFYFIIIMICSILGKYLYWKVVYFLMKFNINERLCIWNDDLTLCLFGYSDHCASMEVVVT